MSPNIKLEKPVVIIEKGLAARQRIVEALHPFCDLSGEMIKKAKDPSSALKTIKDLAAIEEGVDLVISDVFSNEDVNICGLIREMEKIPSLWNTPIVIYTNETDDATYNNIRKDIVHLPFRMAPKKSTVEAIGKIFLELLEYKAENRHYLDLEIKLSVFIERKNLSLLPTALQMIDKCHKEHPSHCTPAKMNLLKGRLYFEFWRFQNQEMESLIGEMQKRPSSDPGHAQADRKISGIAVKINELKTNAERYFLAAYHLDPGSWICLRSFYHFYMEDGEFKKAKEYLAKLIDLFPSQSEYFFKMGRIYEFEGDLSHAVQCYFDAFHSALEEGIGNFDVDDMVEVIDASLNVAKELMSEIGLAHIETRKYEPDSQEYAKAIMLRRNNAQVRSALFSLSGKNPKNSDYLNKIGITYRRAGDYTNAIDMYSQALKLAPDNYRIRVNLAVGLALCETWDQALKEAQKARTLNDDPEDAATLDNLIDILRAKDQARLLKILS
jgi:tetratricopeptide (TPR) repeat protein